MSPRFFSVFMRVSGLFRADFSKSPHRGCPTPKRAKTAKNRFLIFIREAVFSFFRHRQRNDFRLSVRAVLGFDRQPGRKKRLRSHPFLQWKQIFSLFPNSSGGEVQRGEQFFPARQSRDNTTQPLPPED